MRIAIDILIGISLFFALAGVIGMLRMPDTFSRMQSATNITTLGVLGVIVGAILYTAFVLHNYEMTIKLAIIGVFYIVTNPISGHALAKGAYKHGVRPDKEMEINRYEEDLGE